MRRTSLFAGGSVIGFLCFQAYSFCMGEPLCQVQNGAMFDPTWFLYASCLFPLLGILFVALPAQFTVGEVRHVKLTEQGYLIRANTEIVGAGYPCIGPGYPMTVGYEAMMRAVVTGDYDYEGIATENEAGGYLYSGTGHGEVYIPSGEILTGAQYRDERLNGGE